MKKQNIIMGISFVLLFVMVIGVSYAAYKFSAAGTKENVISTGTISMSYSQNSFIDLKNTYPKTDTYAIATKEDKSSMEFSVSMETSGTKQINYALAITNIEEGTTLKSDKVKIYLEKEGKVVNNFETNKGKTIDSFKNKYIEGLIDSYAIYQDILTPSNKTHHYVLTSWIDESYILPIKNETTTTKQTNEETYKFKVKVVGVDTPITIKEKSNATKGTDTLIALTNNKDSSGLYTITHPKDSTLQIGATEDITEYRYRGASPKNYVNFNNETWRIIGIFPTDDGTGKIENRIKIVRNENIGNKRWDTTGLNNWARPATLNTELNTTYLNSLTREAQSMIGDAKYYLGGITPTSNNGYTDTPLQFYSYERKTKNTTSNEFYYGTYPNSWVGKLSLMYVSDYGYASSNCENKRIYGDNDIRGCNNTNWLYNIKIDEWLLPQYAGSNGYTFLVGSAGLIDHRIVGTFEGGVRPVLYLTSSVQITGGNGTSTDPYVIGMDKQDASGANAPVLASNMIPVYYDEAKNVWKCADKENKDIITRWYHYDYNMWANAVTINYSDSSIKNKYFNSDGTLKIKPGEEVLMDDITTMWVWIPRFNAVTPSNYNGGTKAKPNAIDVTFVKSNETALDAFTFGNKELSGFWYGKFETSHATLTSSTVANNLGCSNETCSNANGIIVKPNVKNLRNNNVSNFFYASRSMEQINNSFGFVKDEVDTHMSKNNEWGAVAYLTQSIYGRCTSSTNCPQIGINNNTSYITGYGAPAGSSSSTRMGTYNTTLGKNASTTGNMYGIYDMSGGMDEYVMGVLADTNGNPRSGYSSSANSGFTGMLGDGTTYTGVSFPDSKYYNLYTGSSYTGHALTETAGWYSNTDSLPYEGCPWFVRGGSFNGATRAGVFNFSRYDGNSGGINSTRMVVTNE